MIVDTIVGVFVRVKGTGLRGETMKKSALKKGVVTKRSTKTKKLSLPKQARKTATPSQSSMWAAELDELGSMTFRSLDEALDTLIDRVVLRLGRGGSEEREFVKLLFETDPGLMKSLRNSVKVRG